MGKNKKNIELTRWQKVNNNVVLSNDGSDLCTGSEKSVNINITKKKNREPVTYHFSGGPGKNKSFSTYSKEELKAAVKKSKYK